MKVRDVPDFAMMALLGLVVGEDLRLIKGELHLISAGKSLWVGVEVLDLLEFAKWVHVPKLSVDTTPGMVKECVPTKRGKDALADWFRVRFPGRKLDASRIHRAKLTAVPAGAK